MKEIYEVIRSYVDGMTSQGADVIVLGCTHFPFLEKEISVAAGPDVRILNPAPAVARQTQRVLDRISADHRGHVQPSSVFYSTGDVSVLRRLAMETDPSLDPDAFKTINI